MLKRFHFSRDLSWIREKESVISLGISVIGIVVLVASILADELGIGEAPGFGKKQAIGTGVGIFIILTGGLKFFFFRKPQPKSKINMDENRIFLCFMILIALLIRLSLLDFVSGDFRGDLSLWYDFIKTHGGIRALRYDFSNYSPPYLYLMTLATFLPIPKLYAIKLISMCFDFLAAVFAYLITRQRYKENLLPFFSLLAVLFSPTVFFNSSLWAQCDIIYTSGLLASIYFIFKGKKAVALFCFSLAVSFKLQAFFLFPLWVILWFKKEMPIKYFLLIPSVYLLSLLPCYLLGRPLLNLLSIYFRQAGTYPTLAANAPNLYQWLPGEHYPLFMGAGMLFAVMMVSSFCFLIYRSDLKVDHESIIKISLLSVLMVPFFLPKMHERYFFPADLLSILYAFYSPRHFYVPLAIGMISFFSYLPFLFGKTVINLGYLALGLAIIMLVIALDLVKRGFQEWGCTPPTRNS